METKIKIIFMGTPEFSVAVLDEIIKNNYEVVAVITAPDKPAGRGQKIKYTAVKQYALENNLPLLQPTNLKSPEFVSQLKSLNANLQIVVAFRMLPKMVWEIPAFGTFNLHASLLPNYRGAAPINWAIINGETKTGVTTFFIDDKIDTGQIIMSQEINIEPKENVGQLHDKLMNIGSKLVVKTIQEIASGNLKTTPQKDTDQLKTAYKLNKENCKINWQKTASEIHNHVRGLSPYPLSWCFFKTEKEDFNVKIHEVKITLEPHNQPIGKIFYDKKELKIAVKDGFVFILNLQFPGKRPMKTIDFINGMNLKQFEKVH